jgi:hypothetical protein
MNVLWDSTSFPSGLSVFFRFCVSSCACDYGGQKQGCRLLFASHIGYNFIRKEKKGSVKCGLRSGISKGIQSGA